MNPGLFAIIAGGVLTLVTILSLRGDLKDMRLYDRDRSKLITGFVMVAASVFLLGLGVGVIIVASFS